MDPWPTLTFKEERTLTIPICFDRFPYSNSIRLSFSALAERVFKALGGGGMGQREPAEASQLPWKLEDRCCHSPSVSCLWFPFILRVNLND